MGSNGVKAAALWAVGLAVLAFPILVAGVGYMLSGGVSGAATALPDWLGSMGYLPWNAWASLLDNGAWLMTWAVISVLFCGGLVWLVWRDSGGSFGLMTGGSAHKGKASGTGEHGTARWSTAAEVARSFRLWQASLMGAHKNPSGIYMGSPSKGRAYVHDSEEHVLSIGAPGSGKSRRQALPTIAVIGSEGRESLVISDPKGELYGHTADWLASQGYDVVRLDFREPAKSNQWDPLHTTKTYIKAGRLDKASASAWDIGHTLGSGLASTEQPFWQNAGESLITALALAVSQGEPPPGGKRLMGENRWTWPTPTQQTMATVFSILRNGGQLGGRIDDMIVQFPPNHPAYLAYGTVQQSEEKTRSSILSTTSSCLQLFGDEGVAYLTATQDHDLDGVGKRPTAVFLIIPDERSTYYPLAALYISQTLQALADLADRNGGRLPVPVTFLLDEFGNLPEIKDFDKTVTVSRGRRIRLVLFVQDLSQIKARYGDCAETIKGNMSIWTYLSTADVATAQEIVTKLGQYTIAVSDRSTALHGGPGGSQQTVTQRVQGRELLTVEELMRWPLGKLLILRTRHFPMETRLPDLSEWEPVWPAIQLRSSEPEAGAARPPEVWRPPEPPRKQRPPVAMEKGPPQTIDPLTGRVTYRDDINQESWQ